MLHVQYLYSFRTELILLHYAGLGCVSPASVLLVTTITNELGGVGKHLCDGGSFS